MLSLLGEKIGPVGVAVVVGVPLHVADVVAAKADFSERQLSVVDVAALLEVGGEASGDGQHADRVKLRSVPDISGAVWGARASQWSPSLLPQSHRSYCWPICGRGARLELHVERPAERRRADHDEVIQLHRVEQVEEDRASRRLVEAGDRQLHRHIRSGC